MRSWSCALCFPSAVFVDYLWVPFLQCQAPELYMLIYSPHKLLQLGWQKTQRTDTCLLSCQTHTVRAPVDWRGTLRGHQCAQIKSEIQNMRLIRIKFLSLMVNNNNYYLNTGTVILKVHLLKTFLLLKIILPFSIFIIHNTCFCI